MADNSASKKEIKVNKGDFGHGSVRRLILSQAVPLTLAQYVQLLYNIVDRVYIGHMPGDSSLALTGIGLCFPIITFISAFVNCIATGAAPLCSMSRGENDSKKADDILHTAFSLQIMIGFIVALLMFAVKKPLLYALGASNVTYDFANDYLSIYLWGTIFFAIGTGMNTFINLQGFPRLGMLTTIIGALINLILDPIFIFGFNMGVRGAAFATLISQFTSAAWVLKVLTNPKRELHISISHIGIKSYLLKKIILLGLPGFIMGATNTAVQSVCNTTLSIYGGDVYVGIMTIINSVREMIGLPINGITGGSQPVLSFNYGAKDYKRVKQGIRFTAFIGFIYTLVFWIITMLFPSFFFNIFSNDSDVISLGRIPFILYFMGFVFMSFQFAGQSTFVALGKPKQAIFFSIFRKIIIVVPLTILLPKFSSLGVLGVFLAEPISNLIGGLACILCMYFTIYRKLE